MTASEHKDELRATRAQLAKVIRRRPKVSPLMAVLLSGMFASVAALVVSMDLLLASAGEPVFAVGEPAPITVRVPLFSGFSNDHYTLSQGAVVVARGQLLDRSSVKVVRDLRDQLPGPGPALAGYFIILFAVALLYTIHLRGSHRGQLLRTQAYTLLLLLGGALVVKMALLFTAMSVFVVPLAAVALVATIVVDRSVGLSTGLLASVLIGMLVPFELGVIAVLLLQAAGACLVAGDRRSRNPRVAAAGLLGGACAALGYIVLYYLTTGQSPLAELADPLHSALSAAVMGGALSGLLAIPLKPLYQFMLGDITKSKLVELEDLSHPLLRQIAENSPGTWQHSLAMANMAEIAANAIGADGRLVRVGAYYHDLGKSLQPKYFIENLDSGESSPHDRLPPHVSCDAIFAHVTEGIRVARQHRLPERIIDFMYMHHGDGLLEYFWAKCRESGNPEGLTEADFRYPGVPPQSRETAILAICDAVEAASRTLKKPDEGAIGSLVQRIVYGKLHLGQLDQSGMSMSDLRKISDSLRETIKHAHHGRIEYPWQREEKKAAEAAGAAAPSGPEPRPATGPTEERAPSSPGAPQPLSTTQRIIHEPRLDSLDTPRPYYYWNERARPAQRPTIEVAPTEPLAAPAPTPTNVRASSPSVGHTTLPVEIEAVVEDKRDAQASAPTVPLLVSESQSVAAPPMNLVMVPDAAMTPAAAPEAMPAATPAAMPEAMMAAAPPVTTPATLPATPETRVPDARVNDERAHALASEEPAARASNGTGTSSMTSLGSLLGGSVKEARDSEPAHPAPAAPVLDRAEPPAESIATAPAPGPAPEPAPAPPAGEDIWAEPDVPLPMGRAITGPPPATRTGPVSRVRDKSKSITKPGFPAAIPPGPEAEARPDERPEDLFDLPLDAGPNAEPDAGREAQPEAQPDADPVVAVAAPAEPVAWHSSGQVK